MRVPSDNPIWNPEDDLLGRSAVARSFAEQVQSLDVTEGVVIGVLGPWGSGKTSFINIARTHLQDGGIAVLDFNPWMFSGAEQLVESFFVEVSAQLKLRKGMNEVGGALEEYGETFSGLGWVPLFGPWIEGGRVVAKIMGTLLQRRKGGISGRRSKVEKALVALDNPIAVVVDDIDRLTTGEIRDVFKLVRLTASFPNVIYIVAFDRTRVENALAEQGIPGGDYLEKILQVGIDLPAVPQSLLIRQLSLAIDNALSGVDNPGPFDKNAWPDIFMEVIIPLLRNMRDVRRYCASVHGAVRDLGGQVALTNVLALEAIRVFMPNVFCLLHESVEVLTTTSDLDYGNHGDPPRLKAQIERLIVAAGDHAAVVQALVLRLFPAGERHIGGSHYGADWKRRWLMDRRVAHEDILHFYLERVAGEGLRAFTDAERAWGCMADREAFDGYLRSLGTERLQDVIASLEVYEEQFTAECIVPGSVVLLNLLALLPQRQGGMFELDARMVVVRVVYRLVRSLGKAGDVEQAVREILPEVVTLSAKAELIDIIGYRDGVGHKLVSEATAAELEKAWRAEVRAASDDRLAQEVDLLRILVRARREAESTEADLVIPELPSVTLGILRSGRSYVRSQSMGARAIRRSPRLAWTAMVELYGDEENLRKRIEDLKAAQLLGRNDLLELADKYLGGWRPEEFGDD